MIGIFWHHPYSPICTLKEPDIRSQHDRPFGRYGSCGGQVGSEPDSRARPANVEESGRRQDKPFGECRCLFICTVRAPRWEKWADFLSERNTGLFLSISFQAEIDEICLSQSGNINNRLLAMIDAAGFHYSYFLCMRAGLKTIRFLWKKI